MLITTKKQFEKYAKEGHLMVHDLEDARIEGKNNWITPSIEKKAYKNEIEIRFKQTGFGHNIKKRSSNYKTNIECIKLAEDAVINAKNKGLVDYSQLLKEGIKKIISENQDTIALHNLLSYLRISKVDFKEEIEQLEKDLPNIAKSDSKKYKKITRVNACRIKKKPQKYLFCTKENLYVLKILGIYGIDSTQTVETAIRNAYRYGVEKLLSQASSCPPEKAKTLEKIAMKNEKILKEI